VRDLAKQSVGTVLWTGAFQQMAKSEVQASFADKRSYEFNGRGVDRQSHLGVDLASVRHAEVPAANHGRVLFAGKLGIYGNCIVIDHGLGIQTLYAHLSRVDATADREVRKGDVIGLTVPGVPGFPHFAHNGHVAWCVTHTFADIHDVYLEQFDQGRVLFQGDWEIPARRPETIAIRGAESRDIEITVTRHGEAVHIEVQADGFLYNMVRAIAGTLIRVGRGDWPPECVGEIVKAMDRRRAGPNAPALGLCLMTVTYPTRYMPLPVFVGPEGGRA